jgi:hypothetical protein
LSCSADETPVAQIANITIKIVLVIGRSGIIEGFAEHAAWIEPTGRRAGPFALFLT